MAKIRVSDIDQISLVNEIEPKVINIALGVENKMSESDTYFCIKADLCDIDYELLIWMLSDIENIKAIFSSMRRRKAQLGISKSTKG